MELENYQKRSEQPAIEEKHIEAVAHSKGTRKRNKFVDSVISEDAHNVKNYIFSDVLIPAFKKTIDDIITNGKDIILYGEAGHTAKKSNSRVPYYRSYADEDRVSRADRYRSASYDFPDLVFESRGEAEIVLDHMFDVLERYKVVTVADLYDLAGEPGRHTDNKFGWTNLGSASVVRVRDGYIVKLPRALAID